MRNANALARLISNRFRWLFGLAVFQRLRLAGLQWRDLATGRRPRRGTASLKGQGIPGFGRPLVAAAAVLVMVLAMISAAVPAVADSSPVTGTVTDSSGSPQASVAVNVLDPSTSSTVASTTTDSQGGFSVSVASGTYNLRFIPPSSSGLQSYLATGVTTGGPPLTVVLKAAVVIQVQGTLQDSEGHVDTGGEVNFSSPLNPGTYVSVDGSGHYSTELLADQNFTVAATVFLTGYINAFTLPAGTLDHDQAKKNTMPVSAQKKKKKKKKN